MKKYHLLLLILLISLLSQATLGQVPHLMNYQGRLLNSVGEPVPDGTYDITFSIYNEPVTPDYLWQETLSVEVTGGFFNVILGEPTPFGDLFFVNGPELFLGIKVGDDPELDPRTPITASGFSLHSEMSDVSMFAQSVEPNTITGEHVVNGSLGLEEINQNGASDGQVVKWMDGAWTPADDLGGGGLELPYSGEIPTPADAFSIFNAGTGVAVRGQSNGNDGVVGWTADPSKSGVYGYSSSGIGVSGRSDGERYGVYGESNSDSAGIFGRNFGDGPGVAGYSPQAAIYGSSPGYAGYFDGDVGIVGYQETTIDTGTAAFFESDYLLPDDSGVVNIIYNGNSDPNIGKPKALVAKCFDPNHRSVAGCFQARGTGLLSISTDTTLTEVNHGYLNYIGFGYRNIGVEVIALNSSGCAQTYSNYGILSTMDDAVYNFGIIATADDDNNTVHIPKYNYGVSADARHADSLAIGVYSVATTSDSAIGVYTEANYGTVNIGLYAKAPSGPNDWAGLFEGDLWCTGSIYATFKYFKMDHPQDPENKYLLHASMESPEMLNVYSGTVILDAKGEASVILPDYFEDINKDYRYQLTAIGAPAPNLYIAEEIDNNIFMIAGGLPGMKVSWEVTGVRNDSYAQAHPMQVEMDKNDRERGKYLHPEVYGLDESYGLTTNARREIPEIERSEWLGEIGRK